MRNLGILYTYEWKKLVKRKMTWIAFLIALAMTMLSVFSDVTGKYYVDGVLYETYYEMMQKDKEYAKALSGRAVDQELIEEMKAAYEKVPFNVPRYSLTDEYQAYARPYSEIFQFVRKTMKFTGPEEMLTWEVDEGAFYEQFRQNMVKKWENNFLLTDGERQFWAAEAAAIEKPIVFGYAGGYEKLISVSYSIAMILMMMVAVCLSDFFAKEHVIRTDQLLHSSRFGKRQLFWAKILAGLSFVVVNVLVIWLIDLVMAFGLYGTDGGDIMIQFMLPDYPMALRLDTAVAIMSVMMLLGALMVGAFVMVLSELMHNSVGTLAVISCVILIPMFMSNPFTNRILAQAWACLPSILLDWDNVLGLWLVPFFGEYLTMWQALPLFYLILSVVLFFIGRWGYRNYQVRGR